MNLLKKVYGFCLFSIFLISCGSAEKKDDKDLFEEKITSAITPKWFVKTPKRFLLEMRNLESPVHNFFDANPNIKIDKKLVNFIIETPKDSESEFKIDLRSGRHYFNQHFCKEKDQSGKSNEVIRTPPFHIGIVPRVFNQAGKPQRIFVFDEDQLGSFKDRVFTARVIGGLILRECVAGKCTRESDWISTLALIGVNTSNPKFNRVSTVEEMQDDVSWNYIQAFLRSGFGSRKIGKQYFPSYQLGALLPADKVFTYFKDHSIFFTLEKMTTLKRGCYKLYDFLWENVGKDSKLEKELRNTNDLKVQARLMSDIKKDRSILFNRRFRKAFGRYHENYLSCEALVYPANVNDDSKRFWFFSFYSMANYLYSQDYYYDCRRNTWRFRSTTSRATRKEAIESAFGNCSIRDIEKSFDSGKVLLKNLKAQDQPSIRFIDYDNHSFGTHNKLFSWVDLTEKRLQCSKEESYIKKSQVFPTDIDLPIRHFPNINKSRVIF